MPHDAREPGPQGVSVPRATGQGRELRVLNEVLGPMLVPHETAREPVQELRVLEEIRVGEGIGT